MSEEAAVSDYEALSEELRKSLGPLESAVQYIQDGIEMEAFRDTRAGKIIIGRSMAGMRAALDIILDPSATPEDVTKAINELRVQHRVLDTIAETVRVGKEVTKRIELEDNPQENPDEL